MTTITTSDRLRQPRRPPRRVHAAAPGPGAGFLTADRPDGPAHRPAVLRTPQLLVLPTIIGALFLFIFRYVFGGAISTGRRSTTSTSSSPASSSRLILWTGMNAPAGVAEDAASGVLRPPPLAAHPAAVGRSPAARSPTARSMCLGARRHRRCSAYAVGFRTHAGVAPRRRSPSRSCCAASTRSPGCSSASGCLAGNAQAAQGMSTLVVIPLTFLSERVRAGATRCRDGCSRSPANQPVTVIINAVRSLMLGGTHAAGDRPHHRATGSCSAWSGAAGILVVLRHRRRPVLPHPLIRRPRRMALVPKPSRSRTSSTGRRDGLPPVAALAGRAVHLGP